MADIKKFTGYIAPDGSTHDTVKKATDHTRALKIKAALKAAFNDETIDIDQIGVSECDRGGAVILPGELADWLLANQTKIEACFNQDVLMRKKRESKPRLAKTGVVPPFVPVEVPSGAPAHAGVMDLDE
jgi:hypothetical protein